MDRRTCFFIGHRHVGLEVSALLDAAVERHISECGVTAFTVGHYGEFDHYAERAVVRAKLRHPNITLTLLLPYHPTDRPVKIPEGVDTTFYPPGMEMVPKRLAIIRANQYMVACSDHLIAYAKYPGAARDLVEYAQNREKHGLIQVENLAETKRK